MDRKRGEDKNWYSLPIEERQRQMEEHGMVGRRYAEPSSRSLPVRLALTTGSGVSIFFADEPLVFKKTDLRNAL